jgi:CsoR family transcriptional regulator, copper-sensing transcriptional repressor
MTDKAAAQQKLQRRVNRIAGQIGGIQRMVEEQRYCVDILNQIAAVRSALDSLGVELLTRHLESCVIGHRSGREHPCAKPLTKDQLLAEVQKVISQFLK